MRTLDTTYVDECVCSDNRVGVMDNEGNVDANDDITIVCSGIVSMSLFFSW